MNSITIGKKTMLIKREWKTAVLATWIIGLFAHAYRFFNFLMTWDSLYNIYGAGDTYGLGRWFLPWAGLLSSAFDMPWVNGALSLFFISAAVVLLVELFEMKNGFLISLCAGVIVTFPTVMSTFAYMYTADCYMLAFLMAVAAVFVTCRVKKYGMFFGMLLLGFGMGIYQAYAATAITLVLIYIIRQFAVQKTAFLDAVQQDMKYLFMLVGGAAVYALFLRFSLWRYGISLAGYQGIGDMGLMSPAEYRLALVKTKFRFSVILGLENGIQKRPYTLLNVILLALLAVLVIYLLIKNRVYEKKLSFAAALAGVCLLPVTCYVVNFTSPSVEYHTLMEMAVCLIYVLLILLLQEVGGEPVFPKLLRCCGCAALALLVYYNVLNANIGYFYMNQSTEKSLAIAANVLDRVESLDEFQTATNKIALMGTYECPTENALSMVPSVMGISSDSFLNDPNHYTILWKNYFGVQMELASYDEMNAIHETEEFQNMPIYPKKGCTRCIDGIIVVRLSE